MDIKAEGVAVTSKEKVNHFREIKNKVSQGCLTATKNLLTCFQFAFNLLSPVQIAQEITRYKENTFTLKTSKRTK